ncbi:MAG: CHASE2 domain-containing protein [Prevotella sp.]|nr:CHASE2 domain-containing protein [Prevotella sp.]
MNWKVFFHRDHWIVTILSFVFMGVLAYVTVNVDFLNPIEQAFSNYSLSDMYYQIDRQGSELETSELITIVDMTDYYYRGDLAEILMKINDMEPQAVGVDIIFEGVRDDAVGNELLQDAVKELGDKAIFTMKLRDYDEDKECFTHVTRSFFADSINVNQGYANFPDNMEARNIRDYTVTQQLNDSAVYSFPYMVAHLMDENIQPTDKVLHIDYSNVAFPVVKASELDEHEDLITGHILMVGTMHEEQDMHLSPIGKMAGLEMQTYALKTILERKVIRDSPEWANYLIAFIVCFLIELSLYALGLFSSKFDKKTFIAFFDKSGLLTTIVVVLWLICINWIGYVVFKKSGIYFDTVLILALVAMLIAARELYEAFIQSWAINHKNKFIESSIFKED